MDGENSSYIVSEAKITLTPLIKLIIYLEERRKTNGYMFL